MQRSSESIACLAAALAKAQAELTNPEKSLVVTIRPNRLGEAERSFRYAQLSSGLDIVRKTLGQHEIATVQTTAIDQTAGIVNLTTVLAPLRGAMGARNPQPIPVGCSIANRGRAPARHRIQVARVALPPTWPDSLRRSPGAYLGSLRNSVAMAANDRLVSALGFDRQCKL